jgi:hypothetical protein
LERRAARGSPKAWEVRLMVKGCYVWARHVTNKNVVVKLAIQSLSLASSGKINSGKMPKKDLNN